LNRYSLEKKKEIFDGEDKKNRENEEETTYAHPGEVKK
jgi:hypothetical protein